MSEEEQIILPDGFRRVEYLESSGTQWIDTGVIPNNETGAYIKALQTVNGNTFPIGAGSNNSGWVPMRLLMKGNVSYPTYRWGTYWSDSSSSFNDNIIYTSEFNWLNDKSVNLFRGEELIISKTLNSSTNINPGCTAAIFAVNNNTGNINYQWKGRVYEVKISQGEEIIKHFIPVYDNNSSENCMYELIEGKAYYNKGTGKLLSTKDFEWNYPLINNNYNLPAGFKKCVYLQSDGTQWIDTGVIPDNETGLYFKALQLSYGNFIPFGVEESGKAIYPPRFNYKDLYYRWYSSAIKMMMTWDKADDLIFHSSLNLYNSKIAKFDSEDTEVVTNIASQTGTFTLPIWLFSYNYRGVYSATYGKWSGRVYRAQITQGNALIHDYVPCLDANGRPCMYDLIESEALYNQSGGAEFAYCVEHQLPSDFIKLKYLESNSNLQHIKTGYIPTNNTGMYVDAYNTVVEDRVVMGMQNTTGNDRMYIGGVMKATYGARYGWGTITTLGGTGDVRFEASLNWLNDKKSIITCPAFAQKVNTLSNLTFTPNQDIYIFGWNRQGSLLHWKGRIYRAKISEGSEIVRDFVPAFDDLKQKPCMYDLINNVAYYNDGEGEFLYNKDVEGTYKGYTGLGCIGNRLGASEFEWKIPHGYVRVAFLESTGTQWMNTNYVPTTYSGVYVKYQATENSKSKNACWPIMSYDDGDHAIAPVTNRYGTSASAYWEIKVDPAYWPNNFSTDYIWEGRINFYDNGITSMKVIKNGNFTTSYKLGSWGSSVRRFEYTPTDPFRICYVKWANKGVVPWIIYNVKITEGTELKRDYIPVIDSSGTPCMYDLVT